MCTMSLSQRLKDTSVQISVILSLGSFVLCGTLPTNCSHLSFIDYFIRATKISWLYSLQPKMETLYTGSKNKTRSWLWLRSWTPYCQLQIEMKKVGKTTRPCRYDLNQIPYDYTVEVRNRFKGLDLIEFLKNYGQRFVTLDKRQGSRPFPRKGNAKKQNGCLRRPYKQLWKEKKRKAKEKRKDTPIWVQSSKE